MINAVEEAEKIIEVQFPVFRKYNPKTDVDEVFRLIAKNGMNPPQDKVIFAVVALDATTKKIIGFASLLVNHFVDPLVTEPQIPIATKVKICDAMLFMVGGTCLYLDIEKIYFVSEVNTDKFVNFIQKQFIVKEFAEGKVYSVDLK